MAGTVDSFDFLFRHISNSFHVYSEVLSLIGAYYVTKKAVLTCYRVQYVIRMHFYPKLRPKRDFVKEFGEWAVVTGSTDGIGKAYAMELARNGVNIILISRSSEKLKKVATEIESFYGVKTHVIKADFSLGSEIYDDISLKLQDMQIGILVNNVGAMDFPQLFLEMDADRIRQLININIGAATMMTKLVLPQMVDRRRGVVVNVSSGTSIHPSPQLALYSACKTLQDSGRNETTSGNIYGISLKAGQYYISITPEDYTYLDVFSQALEYEYRDRGIIVQTLLPSYVATKMADFGETMPRSRFLIPSAAVYAKNAVASIGIANRTAGYWPHAVQSWIARQIPRDIWMWGANILNSALRRQFEVRKKLKVVKSSSRGRLAGRSPTAESASKPV